MLKSTYTQRYLAVIWFMLIFCSVGLAIYLDGIGKIIPVYILVFISSFSLVYVFISLKYENTSLSSNFLMLAGGSFEMVIYFFANENLIGGVWLVHSLLFAYYLFGFKKAMKWNGVYFLSLVLIQGYMYLYVETITYPVEFIVSTFSSLLVAFIALTLFGYNIEKLTNELKLKNEELKNSLEKQARMQKQLVESEKMSALGSLVGGVAHEINTPLGISITGITYIESTTKDMIEKIQNEKLTKSDLDEYLDTVESSSRSMHMSLKNAAKLVRSFKQVAIDQHSEEKRRFNLDEYIDEILLSLHNTIKHENISIKTDIDKEINLNSYPGAFLQLLTNFIMNSIIHGFEFKEKEKEILIYTKMQDGDLYFIYEDNGVGVAKDKLSRIFDPFYTTKMGQGGSGLGLNIVYNLVHHKLKGEIFSQEKENGIKIVVNLGNANIV